MEHYISYDDCIEQSKWIFAYDEKVVLGKIVQVYYISKALDSIKQRDAELSKIASLFGGVATGENSLVQGRRDIDFEFPSKIEASAFVNHLDGQRVYIHEKLNIFGNLVDKPSVEKIEAKRERLNHEKCKDLQ
jgi:hypothetical protein